jgi:hypothetical protein
MKLNQFFKKAVDLGIAADPRGKERIQKQFKKEKDRQKKLEGIERELFDEERTWNPFGDSRIINGTGEEEFTNIVVGIDMETSEFLLIDHLRRNGQRIDGALIHHPEGRALADLPLIMPMLVDMLAESGLHVNQVEGMLRPRVDRVYRSIHSDNLLRTERAAQLLKIPAVCCHTITDNLVYRFMEKHFCSKEFDELGDIIKALLTVPEFKFYAKHGVPPAIVSGGKTSRPGKVRPNEFTGGTNGPEEFFEAQARAGVGTILSMHINDKSLEEAKKHHINVIQCCHMAADSLGMNLLLDQIEKIEPKLKIFEISGFIRVKRRKN